MIGKVCRIFLSRWWRRLYGSDHGNANDWGLFATPRNLLSGAQSGELEILGSLSARGFCSRRALIYGFLAGKMPQWAGVEVGRLTGAPCDDDSRRHHEWRRSHEVLKVMVSEGAAGASHRPLRGSGRLKGNEEVRAMIERVGIVPVIRASSAEKATLPRIACEKAAFLLSNYDDRSGAVEVIRDW